MAASYEGNAGAGGKFRKKPFRRTQTTPYDRPITALRPAQVVVAERNGWLSKLVEPASKLITTGAHKLFSSVFRKRLLPPPTRNLTDENMEITNMQPQAVTVVVPSVTKEPTTSGVDVPSRIPDSDGIAELEDILKQKTFTRSEIDHLTTLLLSRTADNSAVPEKSSEPKTSVLQVIHCRNENQAHFRTQENVVEHVVPGPISAPAMKSKVLEEDVASPAELAKAYMGSRPRQVSPSVLGLKNQMSREHLSAAANNPPFKLRSPVTSLLQKPVSDVGISENGFVTPRTWGKSAVYCMARTPYFRIHPAGTFKDVESTVGAHGGSFSSQKTTESDQLNGSKKQVLKRRSSVLENDIGSVGPIRRIRQKPNLLHPKILTLPASDGSHSTNVYGTLSDAAEMPSSSNWNSRSHSFSKSMADNSIPGTSSAFVPSQSIETAQKIFQQLDKFTPKGKSPDLKNDIGGRSSPSKMTSTMLGSPAGRSTATADASKVSQSNGDGKKENASSNSTALLDAPPKMSLMVEEASLKKVEGPYDNQTLETGMEVRMPNSNASHSTKVTDGASRSNFDHPPKKRAFQMSAHEDFLEPDDDVHLNGVVSTPLTEGGENTGFSKKSVAVLDIPSQNEKPTVPEQNSSANSLLSRKDSESLSNGPVTAGNATSFTFPVAPSSSPATSMGVPATSSAHPSALVSDKDVQQNESKIAVTAFSVKSDKLPPLVFSTTSSVLESAVQKDAKLELPNSANDLVSNTNGSTENDKKSTQEASGKVEKSEDSPSLVAGTAKGIFSFGLPVNNPSVNNGLPSTVSTTSTASSSHLFSSTLSKQSPPVTLSRASVPLFSGGFSLSNGFASSASTSSTAAPAGILTSARTTSNMANFSASSSQLPSSVTASSVSTGPVFHVGSSTVPLTLAASASDSSALESTEKSGAKSSETAFGSTTSSGLFSTKSSVTSSGGIGNGIFGFNASTITTASGEGPTDAPAASSGSIFGFQASSTAPFSTSTPSFPTLFSSSTTTPVFGFGGATNPSSGASGPSPDLFSSGSALASSSSGATSSMTSSSGTTSNSIFNSSWQPSKLSFPTFGTTSPSTGFSFGASASGTSADSNKTSVVFGSTNSNSSAAGNSTPFLFGAASNSSSAPVFSFGGTTITSTPISTAASLQPAFGNSTSTTAFAFGSTPPVNNDQMHFEDSMAEDSMQASSSTTPVFGQPLAPAPSPAPAAAPAPPTSSFMFGQMPSPGFGGAAAPPSTGNPPFQFGSQQNQMTSPSSSPFQPSGSVEFNAGGAGSFSLGTGGDKANRKFVKVNRRPRRK